MQNNEEWEPSYYLRDVAEEVAKYTFNHGKYPAIKFLPGEIGPDTLIKTDTNGSLNVYIPQDFDRQRFQQDLQGYIENGSHLMYGQSPCIVKVKQCSKEQAKEVQKEIHKWNKDGTKYYRLIQNPNDTFYVMTCAAPTPQIKQQIQRQFEQGNSYYNGYYYQTDAGEINSSESLSKEDIYLTALKLFYITGNRIISFQNLPKPDTDDEEQKKLYDVCKLFNNNPNHYYYELINLVHQKIHDEQFDLDGQLKEYAEHLKKFNLTQPVISQVPIVYPQVQAPMQVITYDNNYINDYYGGNNINIQNIGNQNQQTVLTYIDWDNMQLHNEGNGFYSGLFYNNDNQEPELVTFNKLYYTATPRSDSNYDVTFIPYQNDKQLAYSFPFRNVTSHFGKELTIIRNAKQDFIPANTNGHLCPLSQNLLNNLIPFAPIMNMNQITNTNLLYNIDNNLLYNIDNNQITNNNLNQGYDQQLGPSVKKF